MILSRKIIIFIIPIVISVFGCVSAPIYNDPLSSIGSKKVSDFSELKLGVIFSDNTRKAVGYTQEVKSIHDSQKSGILGILADQNIVNEISKDADANFLTINLNKVLMRTFKEVVVIGNLNDAEKEKLDLAMILDIRVDLGSFSFTKSTVDISGIFYNSKKIKIDNVVARGEGTIPFPASHYAFRPAATAAINLFEHNLGSSKKLASEAKRHSEYANARDTDLIPEAFKANSNNPGNQMKLPFSSIPMKTFATGFSFGGDKHLLTNFHVVKAAKKITAVFRNGEKIEAIIVVKDEGNDLAVLELKQLPQLPLINIQIGKSQNVKIGDEVFTIGYPISNILGQKPKYSEGVVSSTSGIRDDPRIFQISVPIQSGNSGGPLFNKRGELVGIVSSSLDADNTYRVLGTMPQNVNFAIKSSALKNVMTSLPNTLVSPTGIVVIPRDTNSLQIFLERVQNNIVLIEANR